MCSSCHPAKVHNRAGRSIRSSDVSAPKGISARLSKTTQKLCCLIEKSKWASAEQSTTADAEGFLTVCEIAEVDGVASQGSQEQDIVHEFYERPSSRFRVKT